MSTSVSISTSANLLARVSTGTLASRWVRVSQVFRSPLLIACQPVFRPAAWPSFWSVFRQVSRLVLRLACQSVCQPPPQPSPCKTCQQGVSNSISASQCVYIRASAFIKYVDLHRLACWPLCYQRHILHLGNTINRCRNLNYWYAFIQCVVLRFGLILVRCFSKCVDLLSF